MSKNGRLRRKIAAKTLMQPTRDDTLLTNAAKRLSPKQAKLLGSASDAIHKGRTEGSQ